MNTVAWIIWLTLMNVNSYLLGKERQAEKEWKEGFFEIISYTLLDVFQILPFIIYNFYVDKNTNIFVYAVDFIYGILSVCYTFYLFKKGKKENRYKYLIASAFIISIFFVCCYLFVPIV